MRVMPHRVASESSTVFAEPELHVGPNVYSPSDPAATWDYVSEMSVRTTVAVEVTALLHSTGLPSLEGVVALLQVDCLATGSRHIATIPVPSDGRLSDLAVAIGAHTVAQRLEVTQTLLLDADRPEGEDLAAYRRGSRLLTPSATHTIILEGSASTFPTEAFDFASAGLPQDAAWKLQFEPDSLDEPYLGAVRLLVNSHHPQAVEILSGRPSLTQSVLFHDVVEQLLVTAAVTFDDVSRDFVADSVGDALNHLAVAYLGVSLGAAMSLLRSDRSETLCRLQAGTGFLLREAT